MPYAIHENDVQYLADDGTVLGEVTFPSCGDGIVDINHTFVDGSLRGQGIAGELLSRTAAELEKSGRRTPLLLVRRSVVREARGVRALACGMRKPPQHIRNERSACAIRPASRLRPRRGARFFNFWALDSRMCKYKAIPRYHNRRSEAWPICRYSADPRLSAQELKTLLNLAPSPPQSR